MALCPAGSGKTFAMVEKVAALADDRIHPSSVLAFTFTRAAGVNMRERAIKRIGEEAKSMFANTFHAFAIKVITENAKHVSEIWEDTEILNGKLDFSIYDQDDRADICKVIINRLGLKVTVSQVEMYMFSSLDGSEKFYKDAELVAKEYGKFCIENIGLDLDNLIVMATKLLKIPEVRQNYLYEFVFIDEGQDTNGAQYELVKALNPKRLAIIADINQSIYGFNGARIENVTEFVNDWPEVEVITFTDNYRSTQIIVDRANEIVKLNKIGTVIDVKAHKDGPDITLHRANNFDGECEFIYKQIIGKESTYKDHAILCRTNKLAQDVADYLKMKDIPVNLVSNKDDPFKLAHVKSVMKFIQFCLNPLDQYAFRQWINFPSRRMTDYQIHKAITDSMLHEVNIHKTIGFAWSDKVEIIRGMKDEPADKVLFETLQVLGVIAEYSSKGLYSRLSDFDRANEQVVKWMKKSPQKTITAFVKHLTIKDIQEKTLEEKDAVTICTIHGSKGLEWNFVYILGVTQDIFPNKSSEIEEERRLMYVAITRAKEECVITTSDFYKTSYGQTFISGPSEFYTLLEREVKRG